MALVRQWMPVYTSVLFMRLVDIISSRPCICFTLFFREMTSGEFPYSTPVGSTVVTCLRQFTEAFDVFLLREGGLGPCLSLCNDRCLWRHAALVVDNCGMAGFAGSGASRAVLAFSLCSLDRRQAQGFWLCNFTGAVLAQGYCLF